MIAGWGCVFVAVQGCEQVFENTLVGRSPALLQPANNLSTLDTLQRFSWEAIPQATLYQLQIVSPSFDSLTRLLTDTLISDNELQVALRPKQQYSWRVRALNGTTGSLFSKPFVVKIQ